MHLLRKDQTTLNFVFMSTLVMFCTTVCLCILFIPKVSIIMVCMGGSRGGQGVPLKNHKNKGFPSNIDPDPLKFTKLPNQHSMMGKYWPTSLFTFQ